MDVFLSMLRPAGSSPCVLAMGNFDGVHLGHRALLQKAQQRALERDIDWGVLTFWPHPTVVLAKERAPKLLTSREQKQALFHEAGADFVVEQCFSTDFAKTSPQRFIEILKKDLRVAAIVVGHDFSFGEKGAGNALLLERHFEGNLDVIAPVAEKGLRLSSTGVRKALSEGRLAEVRAMLGRDFALDGIVIRGDGRGRTIGFPTLNLDIDGQRQVPKFGVYAVAVDIDGRPYEGVANVGIRPTFEDQSLRVEVHLFGVDEDFYDLAAEVRFLSFLREEERFANLESLKNAIANDVSKAKSFFASKSVPK